MTDDGFEPDPEQAPAPLTPAPAAEPAVATGGLVALCTVIFNGLVIFGLVNLSVEQKTYVLGAIAIIAPIVAGFWIRAKVWSPATVAKLAAAYRAELLRHQRDAEKAQATTASTQSVLDNALPAAIAAVLNRQQGAQVPQEGPTQYVAPPPSHELFLGRQEAPAPAQQAPEPWRRYGAPEQPVPQPSNPYGYQPQYDPAPAQPEPPRGYGRRHAMPDDYRPQR